jgi:hypothetical protein
MKQRPISPLTEHDPSEASVFLPRNLLDGARRYKNLPERRVPAACLLDMDGELLERLVTLGFAWGCGLTPYNSSTINPAHDGDRRS